MDRVRDFDRFLAEREQPRMTVRILGRDCEVPRELPWVYMLKVERMLRTGEPIPGEDNVALVRRVLSKEDFEYVTGHPDFRASWFWELIAFAWLRAGEPDSGRADAGGPDSGGPVFRNEDDVRAAQTRASRRKRRRSARSSCGRTSRLTSSGSTASTCSRTT